MSKWLDLERTLSSRLIAMETNLTIQQVAALTHLSVHTLRYYERIGLLDSIERASSGHRRYSSKDLAWIKFLNRLRATGMPIRKMQQFAALRRQGEITVSERRKLLEAHRVEVLQQLHELQSNLATIEQKIEHYQSLEKNHDSNTINGTSGSFHARVEKA